MTSGNGKYQWSYSEDSKQAWDAKEQKLIVRPQEEWQRKAVPVEEDYADRAWLGGVLLAAAFTLGVLVGWLL